MRLCAGPAPGSSAPWARLGNVSRETRNLRRYAIHSCDCSPCRCDAVRFGGSALHSLTSNGTGPPQRRVPRSAGLDHPLVVRGSRPAGVLSGRSSEEIVSLQFYPLALCPSKQEPALLPAFTTRNRPGPVHDPPGGTWSGSPPHPRPQDSSMESAECRRSSVTLSSVVARPSSRLSRPTGGTLRIARTRELPRVRGWPTSRCREKFAVTSCLRFRTKRAFIASGQCN